MKRAAKLVHHLKYKYHINKTMRQEIEFFRVKLHPSSGILWETPIAHIIPRTLTATAFGDSCLEGVGGYSIPLGFWWHIAFPDEVIWCMLLYKKKYRWPAHFNQRAQIFMVIINYCASLHVMTTKNVTDDPYPVLLNITNNTSTQSWTNHTCKKSKIGRLLAHFFCLLLINSPLGINSQWISTDDNKIADNISCVKKSSSNTISSFNYSTLC